MTRSERLREQELRQQRKLEAVRANRRAQEQHERQERHARIGRLAEAAGLFALADPVLAGLFAALTPLCTAPDPVVVLERLMQEGLILEAHVPVSRATPNGAGAAVLGRTSP